MSATSSYNVIKLNEQKARVYIKDGRCFQLEMDGILTATDHKQQLDFIKQVSLNFLVSKAEEVTEVFKFLTYAFLECDAKNPCKKNIISCFNSYAQSHSVDVVKSAICEGFAEHACRDFSDDVTESRKFVDAFGSLIENFPLGLVCLEEMLLKCLDGLSNCLSTFMKILGDDNQGSDKKLETINHCHATVQLLTKVVGKMTSRIFELSTLADCDDNHLLYEVVSRLRIQLYDLLGDESVVLDIRSSVGVCVVAIMKAFDRSNAITFIQQHMFLSYNYIIDSAPNISNLPIYFEMLNTLESPVANLCFYAGILSMVDAEDLIKHKSKAGETLMTEALPKELLNLLVVFENNTGPLLNTLKTISQWTMTAGEILQNPKLYSEYYERFCGHSDTVWEILENAITYHHHPADAIRYQARNIFNGILNCHTAIKQTDAKGESKTDDFLAFLVYDTLSLPIDQIGRYMLLDNLSDYPAAREIMCDHRNMAANLVDAAKEQTLAPHVCNLFITLCESDCEKDASGGVVKWMTPVIEALTQSTHHHKQNLFGYILPKLFEKNSSHLTYIIRRFSYDERDESNLGAYISCLCTAQKLNLLTKIKVDEMQENLPMWRNVILLRRLKRALHHQDEQIRSDAVCLLCGHPKMTEPIDRVDLDCVCVFIQYNLKSQSSSFRQVLMAALKKLFQRILQSSRPLEKIINSEHKSQEEKRGAVEYLQSYKSFLKRIFSLIFDNLHSEASFSSRTSSLDLLIVFLDVFQVKCHQKNCQIKQQQQRHNSGVGDNNSHKIAHQENQNYGGILLENTYNSSRVWPEDDNFRDLSIEVTSRHCQTLLQCINDTFEHNRKQTFNTLGKLPQCCFPYNTSIGSDGMLKSILHLISSTQPQDCAKAAYLLRLYIKSPYALEKILDYIKEKDVDVKNSEEQSEDYLILNILLAELVGHIKRAESSLTHAASAKPMYPVLHCIRLTLRAIDFKELPFSYDWELILTQIIDSCFNVAQIVSPVVKNESPEGNVPVGELGYLGPGLELDRVLEEELPSFNEHNAKKDVPTSRQEDDVSKEAEDRSVSESRSSLMPEYILVCCWRSIKEVSLLLAQIVKNLSIITAVEGELMGFITIAQIREIGSYFVKQLLESCHRGAFELAYTGFVQVAETLWGSEIPELRKLPCDWLKEVMSDIESRDPDNRLCATRRSAGTPFFVQALVSTEPPINGRLLFKSTMQRLLQLALPSSTENVQESGDQEEEERPRIHSLNILRALFRDTRLAEDSMEFAGEGFKVAILGYNSDNWAIRNSSTLLFAAVMTRVFGVQRSKEETNKKNRMTGRVFFNRYPSCFSFLLDQLRKANHDRGDNGRYELNPGLFPILLILGRLYPSNFDLKKSELNLSAFVPHVIRCGSSSVCEIREMSGRAISPLVSIDNKIKIFRQLLKLIPERKGQHMVYNRIHGSLIQIYYLLTDVTELQKDTQQEIYSLLQKALLPRFWILESQCYLVRSSFLKVCMSLLTTDWGFDFNNSELSSLQNTVLTKTTSLATLATREPFRASDILSIGIVDFMTLLADSCLRVFDRFNHVPGLKSDGEYTVEMYLRAVAWQVRQVTLQYFLTHDKTSIVLDLDLLYKVYTVDSDLPEYKHYQHDFINLLSKVIEQDFQKCSEKMDLCKLFLDGLEVLSTPQREEVECAAMILCAATQRAVIGQSLKEQGKENPGAGSHPPAVKEFLRRFSELNIDETDLKQWENKMREWCSRLFKNCLSYRTEAQRSCAAHGIVALLQEKGLLKVIDRDCVFQLWHGLMLLLQDESPDVRSVILTILKKPFIYRLPQCDESISSYTKIQDTVALPVILELMFDRCCFKYTYKYIEVLCGWILNDLDPEWKKKDSSTIRLFDRGEMNPYYDTVQFIRAVAVQLNKIIRHYYTPRAQNGGQTQPGASASPRRGAGEGDQGITLAGSATESLSKQLEELRAQFGVANLPVNVGCCSGCAEYGLSAAFCTGATYNANVLEDYRLRLLGRALDETNELKDI